MPSGSSSFDADTFGPVIIGDSGGSDGLVSSARGELLAIPTTADDVV